jgi:hypothetical protein
MDIIDFGVNLTPLIPMRTEPAEVSEMCSQLLYGETFCVIEERERWLYIYSPSQQYYGWIDRKIPTIITEEEYNERNEKFFLLSSTWFSFVDSEKLPIFVPMGARFREKKQSKKILSSEDLSFDSQRLIFYAKQLLNAPYLWGGRTILGIDCSGFSQLIYCLMGIQLPRDASQQAKVGRQVNLSEAKAGDLAFFNNEKGNITHVGILIDNQTIIHASGIVKIEKIDTKGIQSKQSGLYTHTLHSVRRVVNE